MGHYKQQSGRHEQCTALFMPIGTPICFPAAPVRPFGTPICSPAAPVRPFGTPICFPAAPGCPFGTPICFPAAPGCPFGTPICFPAAPVRPFGTPICSPAAPVRPFADTIGSPAYSPFLMGHYRQQSGRRDSAPHCSCRAELHTGPRLQSSVGSRTRTAPPHGVVRPVANANGLPTRFIFPPHQLAISNEQ
jgi:hypothetical protein